MSKLHRNIIAELQKQLAEAKAAHDHASKLWRDECLKNAQAIALESKFQRAQHQLEVIELIAAGKVPEAIQSVLRTDEMLFNIEVHFADDKTQIAAEDEMFAKLKEQLVSTIQRSTIVRKKAADA